MTATRRAARSLQDHAALWRMAEIDATDVVDAACEALVAGLDSPGLRILAGLTRAEAYYEVADLLPAVLEELGLVFPPLGSVTGQEASARAAARRLLAGELTPRAFTRHIYGCYGYELPLTRRLAELDDEYDEYDEYDLLDHAPETGRGKAELDAEVTAEAHRLVTDLRL
ncbi:hypothetical protein SAMN04487983_103754 [Streptomyces sp. yr375]|uniref:hypothetical protein n=1 Tax=Streptomyces sp. yr375 TaxID=1761906 RepID=UPI0008D41D60|nr:hypothetical protein [Streptomyces sp. yr375]SES23623.1 hypothetical protein SAMN04487983_103754 [Streptomyces sp. yr375]